MASRHFGKSPDKLSFEDVRKYQLHFASRGLQAAPDTHSRHKRISIECDTTIELDMATL